MKRLIFLGILRYIHVVFQSCLNRFTAVDLVRSKFVSGLLIKLNTANPTTVSS